MKTYTHDNGSVTYYATTVKEARQLIRKAELVFVHCAITCDDVEEIETDKAKALRSIADYSADAPFRCRLNVRSGYYTTCFIGA